MKKSMFLVLMLVLGLSNVASALTYIDTPEGRRPVEGGEWFVTGMVDVQGQDFEGEWERETASVVNFRYYLTPQISFTGAGRWASFDGQSASQPYYSISLGSNLTDHLELQFGYDWTESHDRQRNSVRVGLYYEHLNH